MSQQERSAVGAGRGIGPVLDQPILNAGKSIAVDQRLVVIGDNDPLLRWGPPRRRLAPACLAQAVLAIAEAFALRMHAPGPIADIAAVAEQALDRLPVPAQASARAGNGALVEFLRDGMQ